MGWGRVGWPEVGWDCYHCRRALITLLITGQSLRATREEVIFLTNPASAVLCTGREHPGKQETQYTCN